MLEIKELSKLVKEEVCDAKKYADLALKWQEKDKQVADTFYSLSGQELQHMEMLHNQVTRLINNYRQTKGEPPKEMLAIYEYVHDEQIEAVSEVKILLNMYKGVS